MKDILMVAIVTGALSALITLVLDKYDMSKRWDYAKPKKLPTWCRLCITFWLGVLIIFLLWLGKLHSLTILQALVAALCAAPISLLLSRTHEDI